MSSQVVKDLELDSVGRQFEPLTCRSFATSAISNCPLPVNLRNLNENPICEFLRN